MRRPAMILATLAILSAVPACGPGERTDADVLTVDYDDEKFSQSEVYVLSGSELRVVLDTREGHLDTAYELDSAQVDELWDLAEAVPGSIEDVAWADAPTVRLVMQVDGTVSVDETFAEFTDETEALMEALRAHVK